MALRMSSDAREASAISPLRTPRERAWPTPMMLSAPEGFTSPTTAQILDVPVSSPTIIEEGSNIFFLITRRFDDFLICQGHEPRFEPAGGQIVGDGEVNESQALAAGLAVIADQPPAPKLALEIVQAENNLVLLAGSSLENPRGAH